MTCGNSFKPAPQRTERAALITQFDEMHVAEFTPEIELDSSSGLSEILRDQVTETNTGTVTEDQGLFLLSTGTTASSVADIRSAERGRYQPGSVGVAGVGVMRAAAPTGEQFWEAGYCDDDDGVVIGEDATGIYFRLKRGGSSISKVYQSGWSLDAGDGTGPSGRTYDPTFLTVVRFRLLWYGSGPVICSLMLEDENGIMRETDCHVFQATAGAPIVEQPKLNVQAKVENGATTSDFQLYVGGRQFGVYGRYQPNLRITPAFTAFAKSVQNGTLTPLVSLRKKTADVSKSCKLGGISITATGGTIKFVVIIGGTLTGPSWGALDYVNANETSLERDITASAISNGTAVFGGVVNAGASSRAGSESFLSLGIDLPDNEVITLAAIANSASVTSTAALKVTEEW